MDHWSLHDRSLLDEREFLSGMKSTLELVSKLLKPRSFKENNFVSAIPKKRTMSMMSVSLWLCSCVVTASLTASLTTSVLLPEVKNESMSSEIRSGESWCRPVGNAASEYTKIVVISTTLAWSCAITACYLHNRADKQQGNIVLSVLVASLWIGTKVLKLDAARVAIWSITCGLFLSAVTHNLCLAKTETSNTTWSEVEIKDTKSGLV